MSFTIFQIEKTPFQAIKRRSSKSKKKLTKSRKIDIFSKGLTNRFGPKMAIYSSFFFSLYRPGKCLLRYYTTKKLLSRQQKQELQKDQKIDVFPKGLIHGYNKKMAIFPTFFFQAIQCRKMSFTIFQKEKTLLQDMKKRSLKSRKIDIFPKRLTHPFGPKMAIFQLFLQAIQDRKMCFDIFQNEKTPFQPIKAKYSKIPKIDIFSKGLTHRFGPKMAIFRSFFLANIGQENVFYDILERNNAFLDHKNQKIKKTKQSRQGKCFFTIFQ